MKVICDVEANGLTPTKIHCIVCKDVDTGEVYEFTDLDKNVKVFQEFARECTRWIGHNFISYDRGVLARLAGVSIHLDTILDTLVVSRTTDASRHDLPKPHSMEAWGVRLGLKKPHADITDWSTFTPEMLERCRGDVEINYKLYIHLLKFINSPLWKEPLRTEHFIAHLCTILQTNGFAFALKDALLLKEEISKELEGIDKELKTSFPPKILKVSEVLPKETKHGTINKSDFRWLSAESPGRDGGVDLSCYTVGAPFTRIKFEEFNPGSPKQIVERLNLVGWQPTEKTKGHRDAEKALRDVKRRRGYNPTRKAEMAALEARLEEYAVTGWSISEENLNTLPDDAPKSAHTLARRLMLANRISTLNQWIAAYDDTTGRIHGHFNHILPWTQRMSHDHPNMGNVPKFDERQPHKTPYSDRMRTLWQSAADRVLVGVDAESIQLRIFGHYINDEGFIKSLISGKKEEGNDPHSLNQRALGAVCKSRDDAKTFIYAWLLGAGLGKVAQILGCSRAEAEHANDSFLEFYPGLKYLKEKVIPYDAERGYFEGFDGRFVRIWGEDIDTRRHYTLAGYLQNGEALIMKRACQIWYPKLVEEKVPFWFVNFVHDEWQTEAPDKEIGEYIARTQADAIRQVGVDLKLRCPMAGSILNAHGKLAIGDNWMETH